MTYANDLELRRGYQGHLAVVLVPNQDADPKFLSNYSSVT